jgi:hypothetical protein
MYYPFFRGKQFELVTIRESAQLLKRAGFVPIIEPVRESLSGLKRTLHALKDAQAKVVLVVNPLHGDHASDASVIKSMIDVELRDHSNVSVGIALYESTSVEQAKEFHAIYEGKSCTFVHEGFTDAANLAASLGSNALKSRHVFFENVCGKLYRRHFDGAERILLRDGFRKRNSNREYPSLESFSDLHATYREEGMDGFGDFLVVGDDYSETGGPAYAVAIHLTCIDPEKDDEMFIHHFKSDRYDTPTDPGGKFAEALKKLVAEVDRKGTAVARTPAVEEFVDLHKRAHFPGLGYVKKLSMAHHIETLARYFKKA